MSSLKINNLQISHYEKNIELKICDSFSETISKGEIVGLFGPNGSGKSSLLRILAGIDKPTKGKITLDEKSIQDARVAYIPQDIENSFFNWASVYRNLAFSLKDGIDKITIDNLWKEFDLDYDNKLRPSKCSGGMLQQAAILRAFINNPKLIIADEPFSALDINKSTKIKNTFRKKIKENNTIAIISLHNIEDFLSICDRLILIPNKPFTSIDVNNFNKILKYNNKKENLEEVNQGTTLKNTIEKILNL